MHKSSLRLVQQLAVCLVAGAVSFSALAQAPAQAEAQPKGQRDCSKAPHPDHCAAMQKAFAACKDKAAGEERRSCMKANMPAKPKS
jgi:hypothetical protein